MKIYHSEIIKIEVGTIRDTKIKRMMEYKEDNNIQTIRGSKPRLIIYI